jgi:hypothetical protein
VKKNLYLRRLFKMSVSLITDYFHDQHIEIINSQVEIPNAFRVPAIITSPGTIKYIYLSPLLRE